MEKERFYRWYFYARDVDTNNILAQDLEEAGLKICWDGKERFLFTTTDHAIVAYIQRSKVKKNMKFDVFVQVNDGQIRPWEFNAAETRAKKKKKPLVKRNKKRTSPASK